MPTEFVQLILQICLWLKSNKFNILVMGINFVLKWRLNYVQTSHFIDVISDNDIKNVLKTLKFIFLQTCTTREYDWIKC